MRSGILFAMKKHYLSGLPSSIAFRDHVLPGYMLLAQRLFNCAFLLGHTFEYGKRLNLAFLVRSAWLGS